MDPLGCEYDDDAIGRYDDAGGEDNGSGSILSQRRQSFFTAISGDIILTDNGILHMGPSAGLIYISTLVAQGPMI